MEIILCYTFFTFSIFWLFREKSKFIFFLPLFSIGLDISFIFLGTLSIPTYLRVVVVIILFIYSYKYLGVNKRFKWLYFFLIYSFILLFFSQEFFYSFKSYMQLVISMLLLPISYYFFDSHEKLKKIENLIFIIILISLISTLVGYIFGIGKVLEYSAKNEEKEIIGLLGSGGLYTGAFCIGLIPVLFKERLSKFKIFILISVSFVLYVFILLNVRRTGILIPIIILSFYFIFTPQKSQAFIYILIGAIFLIITSGLYISTLNKRLELREGRFEEQSLATESRTKENITLFKDYIKFEDPLKSLFGIGNNIFAEHVENSKIVRRMYHSDTAKLFIWTGF